MFPLSQNNLQTKNKKKLANTFPNWYEKYTKQKVIEKKSKNQDMSYVIIIIISSFSIFFQNLHGFSKIHSEISTFNG